MTHDTQSLAEFRDHPNDTLQQIRETKRPVTLTVDGKPAAVLQDAEAYQMLLDLAAEASAVEGIRQGLEEVKNGRTRPAKDFFDGIRAEYGIPR